jgi:poly(3-hydroxybutyrate) depolymerase
MSLGTVQACTPARTPLPVPEIHDESDTDVPYAGGAGEGRTEPAIVDW